MEKLIFLGCGNSVKSYYGTNAAVLKTGRNLLLFDCGPHIPWNLKNSGLDEGVDHIDLFISHIHGDHIGGVKILIEQCEEKNVELRLLPSFSKKQDEQIVGVLAKQGIKNHSIVFADPAEVAKNHNLRKIEFKRLKHTKSISTTAMVMKDMQNMLTYYAPDHNDPDEIKKFFKGKYFKHLYTDVSDTVQPIEQTHIHIRTLSLVAPTWLYEKVTVMHLNSSVIETASRMGFNNAAELLYNARKKTTKKSKEVGQSKLSRLDTRKLTGKGIVHKLKDIKKHLVEREKDEEVFEQYGIKI